MNAAVNHNKTREERQIMHGEILNLRAFGTQDQFMKAFLVDKSDSGYGCVCEGIDEPVKGELLTDIEGTAFIICWVEELCDNLYMFGVMKVEYESVEVGNNQRREPRIKLTVHKSLIFTTKHSKRQLESMILKDISRKGMGLVYYGMNPPAVGNVLTRGEKEYEVVRQTVQGSAFQLGLQLA